MTGATKKPVVPAEVLLRIVVPEGDDRAMLIPGSRDDVRTMSSPPWTRRGFASIEFVGWRNIDDEQDEIRVSVFARYEVIGAKWEDQDALQELILACPCMAAVEWVQLDETIRALIAIAS